MPPRLIPTDPVGGGAGRQRIQQKYSLRTFLTDPAKQLVAEPRAALERHPPRLDGDRRPPAHLRDADVEAWLDARQRRFQGLLKAVRDAPASRPQLSAEPTKEMTMPPLANPTSPPLYRPVDGQVPPGVRPIKLAGVASTTGFISTGRCSDGDETVQG
jgi:hypothetical protein